MGHWYTPKEKKNKVWEDDMNRVTLMGRIGSDIELKEVNGESMAKFSLATSERWKNKSGEKQEKTTWHNVTVWKNLSKVLAQYTGKGKRVMVEGKIDNRTWDKKDGTKGYATDIVASNVSIIDFNEDGKPVNTGSAQVKIDTSDLPF